MLPNGRSAGFIRLTTLKVGRRHLHARRLRVFGRSKPTEVGAPAVGQHARQSAHYSKREDHASPCQRLANHCSPRSSARGCSSPGSEARISASAERATPAVAPGNSPARHRGAGGLPAGTGRDAVVAGAPVRCQAGGTDPDLLRSADGHKVRQCQGASVLPRTASRAYLARHAIR